MPASWNEQSLEQLIADHLIINGYHTGHSSGFSANHGVDLSFLLKFLESTQPDELDEWKREAGAHWQTKLLDALRDQIGKRGVATLWREELKCGACRFKLYFPRPTNAGDDKQNKRWQSNLFSVTTRNYPRGRALSNAGRQCRHRTIRCFALAGRRRRTTIRGRIVEC